MRFFAGLALFSVLLTNACSEPAETACAGDGVQTSDAWLRATRAGQKTSAAYVRLCNGAEVGDRLVAASFEGAQAAELHATTLSADGVASMAPVEGGLALPPGETVVLKPGSTHIMLIGVTESLAEGGVQMLTLQFENAGAITVPFEVRASEEGGHSGH